MKKKTIRKKMDEILKRLRNARGGAMLVAQFRDMEPTESSLHLLEHILHIEQPPEHTLEQLLLERGVAAPDPETLSDEALHEKLWDVIRAMAEIGIFLRSTDHLSDRQLYDRLWRRHLDGPAWDLSANPAEAETIDLIGSGSDEDVEAWLTYYAQDFDREDWSAQCPEATLPPHREPPFDRDAHLPKADDRRRESLREA